MTAPITAGLGTPYGILRELYPGLPARQTGTRALGRPRGNHRRYLAVPNLDDTRMFLPAESSLAAGTLRRARRSIDLRGRVVTSVAATGLRLGLGRMLPSHLDAPVTADCVETQLAALLQREVRVAIFLGPPRANRKPVLQVLGTDGGLLAVAKAGVNTLTSDLARGEAAALRTVAQRGFATVVTPTLLGEETRGGHTMVVQSPLEVPGGPATPEPLLLRTVFNEISRSGGVTSVSLAESDYIEGLRRRVSQTLGSQMSAMGSAVLAGLVTASPRLDFGSWHGDLSPWNMAADGDRVLVWDWERFADGVPLGYDALHYTFLPLLKNPRSQQGLAGVELFDRAGTLLEGVGVNSTQAPAVAVLYLLELAGRFVGDGQASTGIRGGDVEKWLVPALRYHLTRARN